MTQYMNFEETTGIDPMNTKQRSTQMSKVKGDGNKSTEYLVENKLNENNIEGWQKHCKDILGKPDFYFPNYKLAIFVNGCFWHACPICKRRIPKSDFWKNKIEQNRLRDNRFQKKLRTQGYHVMRIWEHELKQDLWLKRLLSMQKRISNQEKIILKIKYGSNN